MSRYALSHLDDRVLLRDLASHVANNCVATADLLAHLAEVDERKLFLPAAHASMHSYCVHVLGMSEDSASKRIQVARKARACPVVFSAVADGRIHLSGAVLLAPHLTPYNVDELLANAARKTKSEIAILVAKRFPKQDVPTQVAPVPPSGSASLLSECAPAPGLQHAPGHVEGLHSKVTPLAPERYSVQFTLGQEAYETLRYTQALLGHQIPSGDVAAVFDRALRALVTELEKTRFVATSRPRAKRGTASSDPRRVPSYVKHAVWERDGGQCGFVSEAGARCPERSRLEFDHILEVARGGEATVEGMRLRCRAHNQYEAERTFGAGFMERKREEAQRAATDRRATAARMAEQRPAAAVECTPTTGSLMQANTTAASPMITADNETDLDLLNCLKGLGVRPDQVRLAVEHSRSNPGTSIEERLHASLKFLGSRGRTYALRQAAMSRSGAAGFTPSQPAAS